MYAAQAECLPTLGSFNRTEVTVRAYQECVTKRQCSAVDHVAVTPEGSEADASAAASDFVAVWTSRCNVPRKALDHPINCVDFTGAETYCPSRGRPLPTEAEWELAARARIPARLLRLQRELPRSQRRRDAVRAGPPRDRPARPRASTISAAASPSGSPTAS